MAAAAIAIGFTTVFGGWNAAEETAGEIPAVAANEQFSVAPFDVTVTRARVFDEVPGMFPALDGYRYLALVADITNSSSEPVDALVIADSLKIDAPGLRTLELDSGPQPVRPDVYRGVDSLLQHTFQPGLTTNIVFVWQQSVAEEIPLETTAVFSSHTQRRSTLDDSLGWRDPVATATVTIAVEPLEAP